MRVTAYIDGYNLYHAIDALTYTSAPNGVEKLERCHFLKWLDVKKLVQSYCHLETQELIDVKFFSASPVHLSESKIKRHSNYIKAIQQKGVLYIEGRFKSVGTKYVQTSPGTFIEKPAYEEKESDVNLAIHIVRDAVCCLTDKAIIITNDSDISPAIRMARMANINWKVSVVTPPLSSGRSVNHDLLTAAGQQKKNAKGQIYREIKDINKKRLLECQLPDQLLLENGELVTRPGKYKVPADYR